MRYGLFLGPEVSCRNIDVLRCSGPVAKTQLERKSALDDPCFGLFIPQAGEESIECDHFAQPRQRLSGFQTLLAEPVFQSTAKRRRRFVFHERPFDEFE
jgi:hypothetical protein